MIDASRIADQLSLSTIRGPAKIFEEGACCHLQTHTDENTTVLLIIDYAQCCLPNANDAIPIPSFRLQMMSNVTLRSLRTRGTSNKLESLGVPLKQAFGKPEAHSHGTTSRSNPLRTLYSALP